MGAVRDIHPAFKHIGWALLAAAVVLLLSSPFFHLVFTPLLCFAAFLAVVMVHLVRYLSRLVRAQGQLRPTEARVRASGDSELFRAAGFESLGWFVLADEQEAMIDGPYEVWRHPTLATSAWVSRLGTIVASGLSDGRVLETKSYPKDIPVDGVLNQVLPKVDAGHLLWYHNVGLRQLAGLGVGFIGTEPLALVLQSFRHEQRFFGALSSVGRVRALTTRAVPGPLRLDAGPSLQPPVPVHG